MRCAKKPGRMVPAASGARVLPAFVSLLVTDARWLMPSATAYAFTHASHASRISAQVNVMLRCCYIHTSAVATSGCRYVRGRCLRRCRAARPRCPRLILLLHCGRSYPLARQAACRGRRVVCRAARMRGGEVAGRAYMPVMGSLSASSPNNRVTSRMAGGATSLSY